MPKKTTDEYVVEVSEKHREAGYDYSKVNYEGVNSLITVVCPHHGEFEVRAGNHLSGNNGKGNGCQKCAIDKMGDAGRKSFKTFLTEAMRVHGNRYRYSEIEFRGYSKKFPITCEIHGVFYQTPGSHIKGNGGKGHGCPKCSSVDHRLTTNKFIERSKKIYPGKLTYKDTVYNKASDKIVVTCKTHGNYTVVAANHLSGNGSCPECVRGRNQFQEIQFEGNKYRGLEDVGLRHGMTDKSLSAFMKRLQKYPKEMRRTERVLREALDQTHVPRDNEVICHGIRYQSIRAFYDDFKPKAHYNSVKRWILEEGIPPEQVIDMEPSVPDGKGVIYLIEGPRQYIGQTTMSLDRRWSAHIRSAREGSSTLLHSAIREHGKKKFRITPITDSVPSNELAMLETRLIDEYKTIHPHGYNMEGRGKSARPRGKPTEYNGEIYPTQSSAAKEKAVNEGISYHCAVYRLAKGIEKSHVKLNWDKVREIRKLHSSGRYSHTELAEKYGCGRENIGSIIRGITWKE